ncbi:BrnA antitoxin family protein [Thalassospira lucentensis]|uniref:BrnA antitoxin family protein n=1 Tax=Thalassospira lucentensis TaxID=168935 RepID=UPI0003B7A49A|nr:BrnA antitoxin family protein [Thalassospira lucentensis]RCK28901.1 hypothetical protein TH1_07185 [Thalassospira lucentensis MCCC 1A00383 = DSM 14000]
MSKRNTEPDLDEIPELDGELFKKARPASEVLPELVSRARGQRGPQKTPTKERVTIRIDADVLEAYRAEGRGWQTRLNDDLRSLKDKELTV